MATPGSSSSDNPFWDYSLALYGQVSVAEVCLALQDRRDLDVNLLLFCCWQAERGVSLTVADLKALRDATAAWRLGMVVPLRRLRRALKEQAWPEAELLLQRIKDSELEAERLEQVRLLERAGPGLDQASPFAAVGNLLAYCLAAGFEPEEPDVADLTELLAAAVSAWSPDQARAALTTALASKRQT